MNKCTKSCKPTFAPLQVQFKTEINDRENEIDPDQERDWFCLTYGWAIGKGLSVNDAFSFALHIRYHTDLG